MTDEEDDGVPGLPHRYLGRNLSAAPTEILKELFSKAGLADYSKLMAIQMLFDNRICQFLVLATCSEVLSPLLQMETLVYVVGPLRGEEAVSTDAFDCLVSRDDALRYVMHLMFGRPYLLALNANLILKGEQ